MSPTRSQLQAESRRAVKAAENQIAEARAAISQGTWPKTGAQMMTEIGAYVDASIAAHNAATTVHGIDLLRAVLSDDVDLIDSLTQAAYDALTTKDGRTLYYTPDTGVGTPSVTYIAQDLFGRAAVTGGWGTADVGGAWTPDQAATNFDTTGATGRIAAFGATPPSDRSIRLQGVNATEQTASFRFALDQIPTAVGYQISVLMRAAIGVTSGSTTDHYYRARVNVNVGGAVTAALSKFNGTAATDLTTSAAWPAGTAVTAGQWIRVLAQVTGTNPTTIRMKAYPDGTAEPSAWLQSITDSEASIQTSGCVGIYGRTATGATPALPIMSFDDLAVV